eukprot:TRINITY_DN43020_c0_g1_i1.p1 TRINITY_DN43020_c0_g1~~TRINITY_DN43020_c0_g1_i1.p1  ORF type:complete len:324 (-),score=59.58 TRINITY_DN43020_c0_g1_i1:380-1351(-)
MKGAKGLGKGSLWDNQLVAKVAFHPRKCSPSSSGRWVDSTVAARDGTKLAYRFYAAPDARKTAAEGKSCVLIYFHANAELCTDSEEDVNHFFKAGFCSVLCPEFRGYAWSEGTPSLARLCPDAEAMMEAVPQILAGAGIEDPIIMLHGRSLGSICAVHIASRETPRVGALVVESGVMDLLKLPMVQQLGLMMPQILQALKAEPSPLHTLEEMRKVTVPTLVIHGEQDEISPVEQAVACYRACGSQAKKLLRLPRCGHNDIRLIAKREYYQEFDSLCRCILNDEEAFQATESNDGLLAWLGGALRCFPGMRRCLADNEDAATPR